MSALQRLFSKNLPLWFRLANLIILIPIIAWPLVFFMTIFFFDDPTASKMQSYGLFFLVNAYPLYLVALAVFNIYIFKIKPMLAGILPLVMAGFLTWLLLEFFK